MSGKYPKQWIFGRLLALYLYMYRITFKNDQKEELYLFQILL